MNRLFIVDRMDGMVGTDRTGGSDGIDGIDGWKFVTMAVLLSLVLETFFRASCLSILIILLNAS